MLHCVTVLHVLSSTQLVTTGVCRQVEGMSRCSPRWRPTCVSKPWVTVGPCQPTSSPNWPRNQVETSSNSQRARDHGSVGITSVNNSCSYKSLSSASIFVVGCLTGSLVGGYQCEHLGRRKSMMLDSVLMLAGFVCVAIAPNVEVFLLGELKVLLTASLALFVDVCRSFSDRSQRRQ